MIEIIPAGFSHFTHLSSRLTRIDRFWSSLPAWVLTNIRISGIYIDCPSRWKERKISDHSPMIVSFDPGYRIPKELQPIPSWITKSSLYRQTLQIKWEDFFDSYPDWHFLPASEMLSFSSLFIRQSAAIARQSLIDQKLTSTMRQQFLTAARTVARNDASLFSRLINTCEIFKNYLTLEENTVVLLDHKQFSEDFTKAMTNELTPKINKDLNRIDNPKLSESARSVIRRRCRARQRLDKLWSPINKQLFLTHLVVDNTPIHDQAVIHKLIAKHWEPEFRARDISEGELNKVLEYVNPICPEGIPFPSVSHFGAFLSRAKDSGAGIDGIRYSALNVPAQLVVLKAILVQVVNGFTIPNFYRAALYFWIPKKSLAEDRPGHIVRKCDELRGIGKRSVLIKTISAVISKCTALAVSRSTVSTQRGFKATFNFVDNVLEMDAEARILATRISPFMSPSI